MRLYSKNGGFYPTSVISQLFINFSRCNCINCLINRYKLFCFLFSGLRNRVQNIILTVCSLSSLPGTKGKEPSNSENMYYVDLKV